MSNFLNSIKARRTIYAIGKNVTVDQAKIEETIREAVKQSPSAFNSQTSRVVTLYGESHTNFWNIVRETLRKIVPAEAFEGTNQKIDSFAAGFGTVLFYEDQDVVKGFSVHDKFHRALVLSGFFFLKIASTFLNSSFFPKPIKRRIAI